MAEDQHTNEQTDDSQRHQADDKQLYVSYLCLALLILQLIDIMLHIHRMHLQCLALTDQHQAVLQF